MRRRIGTRAGPCRARRRSTRRHRRRASCALATPSSEPGAQLAHAEKRRGMHHVLHTIQRLARLHGAQRRTRRVGSEPGPPKCPSCLSSPSSAPSPSSESASSICPYMSSPPPTRTSVRGPPHLSHPRAPTVLISHRDAATPRATVQGGLVAPSGSYARRFARHVVFKIQAQHASSPQPSYPALSEIMALTRTIPAVAPITFDQMRYMAANASQRTCTLSISHR